MSHSQSPYPEPIPIPSHGRETWQLRAYSASDISDTIVRRASHRNSQLARRQQDVVDLTYFLRNRGQPRHHINTLDEDIMLEYFRRFDNLFFYGALDPYVRRRFGPAHDGFDGYCSTTGDQSTITICRRSCEEGSPDFQNHFPGTLLHEMLHAFFDLFTHPNDLHQGHACGWHGHGPAWQRAAFSVDQAVRDWLNLSLDIGAEQSLAYEMGCAAFRDQVAPSGFAFQKWVNEQRHGVGFTEAEAQDWGFDWLNVRAEACLWFESCSMAGLPAPGPYLSDHSV